MSSFKKLLGVSLLYLALAFTRGDTNSMRLYQALQEDLKPIVTVENEVITPQNAPLLPPIVTTTPQSLPTKSDPQPTPTLKPYTIENVLRGEELTFYNQLSPDDQRTFQLLFDHHSSGISIFNQGYDLDALLSLGTMLQFYDVDQQHAILTHPMSPMNMAGAQAYIFGGYESRLDQVLTSEAIMQFVGFPTQVFDRSANYSLDPNKPINFDVLISDRLEDIQSGDPKNYRVPDTYEIMLEFISSQHDPNSLMILYYTLHTRIHTDPNNLEMAITSWDDTRDVAGLFPYNFLDKQVAPLLLIMDNCPKGFPLTFENYMNSYNQYRADNGRDPLIFGAIFPQPLLPDEIDPYRLVPQGHLTLGAMIQLQAEMGDSTSFQNKPILIPEQWSNVFSSFPSPLGTYSVIPDNNAGFVRYVNPVTYGIQNIQLSHQTTLQYASPSPNVASLENSSIIGLHLVGHVAPLVFNLK